MEVYLNVAETGIGTYGVNAGAQRYFGHDASSLAATEAARIAAVFPLPKRRRAVAPTGFTRRYGNMITARMAIVRRDGLDACVYEGAPARDGADRPEPVRTKPGPRRESAPEVRPAPADGPEALPGEEFEAPEPTGAPEPVELAPPPPMPATEEANGF